MFVGKLVQAGKVPQIPRTIAKPMPQRQPNVCDVQSCNRSHHWEDYPIACNHFVRRGGAAAQHNLDPDLVSTPTHKRQYPGPPAQ